MERCERKCGSEDRNMIKGIREIYFICFSHQGKSRICVFHSGEFLNICIVPVFGCSKTIGGGWWINTDPFSHSDVIGRQYCIKTVQSHSGDLPPTSWNASEPDVIPRPTGRSEKKFKAIQFTDTIFKYFGKWGSWLDGQTRRGKIRLARDGSKGDPYGFRNGFPSWCMWLQP